MKLLRTIQFLLLLTLGVSTQAVERKKYNFNSEWRLCIGDFADAEEVNYDDAKWQQVTLPHAFNEDEAFCKGNKEVTDTIVWYRKHFIIPQTAKGGKVFIEFEGARQSIDVWVNGQKVTAPAAARAAITVHFATSTIIFPLPTRTLETLRRPGRRGTA